MKYNELRAVKGLTTWRGTVAKDRDDEIASAVDVALSPLTEEERKVIELVTITGASQVLDLAENRGVTLDMEAVWRAAGMLWRSERNDTFEYQIATHNAYNGDDLLIHALALIHQDEIDIPEELTEQLKAAVRGGDLAEVNQAIKAVCDEDIRQVEAAKASGDTSAYYSGPPVTRIGMNETMPKAQRRTQRENGGAS